MPSIELLPPTCCYSYRWDSLPQQPGAPPEEPEPEPEPQQPAPQPASGPLPGPGPGRARELGPRGAWCEDAARAAFRSTDADDAGWIPCASLGAALSRAGTPVAPAEATQLLARIESEREDADYLQVDEFCRLARWVSEGLCGAAHGAPASARPAGQHDSEGGDPVLAAVLGGAMELPPVALLRTMSGACRPYRYSARVRLRPQWLPAPCSLPSSAALMAEHT